MSGIRFDSIVLAAGIHLGRRAAMVGIAVAVAATPGRAAAAMDEARQDPEVAAPAPAPTASAPAAAASDAPSAGPPPGASASSPAVSEDVWTAMKGRQVSIETPDGPVDGELASADGDSVVLIAADGSVRAIPKANAQSVKVVRTDAGPTTAVTPTPAASSTPEPAAKPGPDAKAEAAPEDETPGEKRRRERREKREHALLGLFTAHGATYTHWRGDGIDSGHASYAMDFGVGFNATKSFGMYAMAGGLLAAKIDHKQVNANYGHVDLMFAFGGKYYHTMFGAGGGFSRLNRDGAIQKDAGLSIPLRIFGKIPLPKKLYIGLGIAYEFAAVRHFDRYINAIGGQLVVGRW